MDTLKATGVVKLLLTEIIPRFGLPHIIQSGPSVTLEIYQQAQPALLIQWKLHTYM